MELITQDCSVLDEIKHYNSRSSYSNEYNLEYNGCSAGQTFFHVNSVGEAMLCQSARDLNINLLHNGINNLKNLSKTASQYLERPEICKSCEFSSNCSTCPPNLRLFQKAGCLPSYICRKYGA